MRKETARGKLASRRNAIECAREPHAIRKRRPTRGQPANHATLHQNPTPRRHTAIRTSTPQSRFCRAGSQATQTESPRDHTECPLSRPRRMRWCRYRRPNSLQRARIPYSFPYAPSTKSQRYRCPTHSRCSRRDHQPTHPQACPRASSARRNESFSRTRPCRRRSRA